MRHTELLKNLLASRDTDLDYATVAPVVQEVRLTLEELYNGGVKTISNSRRVLDVLSAGLTLSNEALELQIVPGWTEGTRVVYPRKGSINLCARPTDLILQIVLEPHPRFRVDGHDLYTTIQARNKYSKPLFSPKSPIIIRKIYIYKIMLE